MKRGSIGTLIGLSILIFSGTFAVSAEVPFSILEELGADEFAHRERAQEKLLEWGRMKPGETLEPLFLQSRKSKDPEVRERCLAVLRELLNEKYLREGEGYVGIQLSDSVQLVPGENAPRGVIQVIFVQPDSPAVRAGIRPNDVIIGVDWTAWDKIRNQTGFQAAVRKKNPGEKVILKLLRGDKVVDLPLVLGRRPASADPAFLNESGGNADAAERAAKEAYFRLWLRERNVSK